MRRARLVLGCLALSAPLFAAAAAADLPRVVVVDPWNPDLDRDAGDRAARLGPALPDPPATTVQRQWIFDLKWSKGDVYLMGVRAWDPGAPRRTPRAMGRFALELWEGHTLLERVRFDFPLMALADTDAGRRDPPSMEAKLTTRIGVIFPQLARGTRLELWDRATDRRWPVPWPVEEWLDAGTPPAVWPPPPGVVATEGGALLDAAAREAGR
jgi:hypothetical protein